MPAPSHPGARPARAPGLEDRLGPLLGRLGLLLVVITGAGVLLGALVLPGMLATADVVEIVREDIFSIPPLPDAEPAAQNSFIYAADGSLIAELNYQENRVPVDYEQIPDVMRQAVIATEDAAFYRHRGLNLPAIVRAGLANVRAGGIAQGGSTITQQFVKNAYIGIEQAEQTLSRKLTEAVWAIEVEQRMSKREILVGYLNYAYFGNGIYGIGTAAERYFSKGVGQLTLAEAATLAGLIRSPEENNPLKDDGRRRARRVRDLVLDQMANEGFITQEQASRAQEQPLELEPRPAATVEEQFWVSWITQLLTDEQTARMLGTHQDALEAMGATSQERIRRVFQSGVRIHTTLRPAWQRHGRAAIREHLTAEDEPPEEIAEEPLGAIVSVEPSSGAIRAMALGPRSFGSCQETRYVGTTEEGRLLCDKTKLNPAVPGGGGTGRQPGSAFKPFVLAGALETGIPPGWTVNASSGQVIDRTACPNNGEPWKVHNAGGGGVIDMYPATKNSVNVYFAKLIAEVGPEVVSEVAHRMGVFHSPTTERWQAVCSQALGTQEVFPLEMASAFATLANRGSWCRPFAISRITERNGDVIYRHNPDCRQVLDSDIADRVVDMLAGPVESGGTAPVANLGRWPTRGKTGTTQDNRDAWFVGFVRQAATAAWIGYPNGTAHYESLEAASRACPDQHDGDPEDWGDNPFCTETRLMSNVTIGGTHYGQVYGGTIPAPMWRTYMAEVVQGLEPEGFPEPGPVPTTRVPDVVSAGSLAEAEQLADAADMQLVTETVEHYLSEGEFVAQNPAAGRSAPAGTVVKLQISDGSVDPPEVPDVVGLTEDVAVERLRSEGFGVEVVTTPTEDGAEEGRVLAQTPEGGSLVSTRTLPTVRLEVGELVEPTPTPTPTPSPTPTTTTEPSPQDDEEADPAAEDRSFPF